MNRAANLDDAATRLWFLNSLVTLHRSSEDGSDGVSVMEFHAPYGDSPPTHLHHDDDEVFHIKQGTVRFRVGDQEFVLTTGQTAVAPKGVPHCFKVESPEGACMVNVMTSANFERFVQVIGRAPEAEGLPPVRRPTPEEIGRLAAAARDHHMEILGPPMA